MASDSLATSLLRISPFILSLLASGLLINLVQLALFLFLRPFNQRLYHRLYYYTVYWIHSHFVFLAEWWGGLDIVCYSEPENWEKYFGREHSLCILNHRYDIDWIVTFAFCDRTNMLGNCRAYAKRSIQNLPIFGWCLTMGGNVFLDRNWEKDRDVIGKQVLTLSQFPSAMSLMMAAEGTRFTPTKHEASQKFAREKGLPGLQHHLTPRTKGFTHTIPFIRGKIPAVYDFHMLFEPGKEPSIIGLLKGERYVAHLYIDRIPLDSLPESEEELAAWVHQLYQKKDKMTDSFFSTGDLFKESGVPRVPCRWLFRRFHSLLNVVFWTLLTVTPTCYYVCNRLLTGSLLHIAIILTVVAICAGLTFIMIRMTQIGKGSAYGSSTTRAKSE